MMERGGYFVSLNGAECSTGNNAEHLTPMSLLTSINEAVKTPSMMYQGMDKISKFSRG